MLVDEVDDEGAIARSSADAPEIDGLVYIKNGQSLKVGEFANVRVTDSDAHDLWAKIVLEAPLNNFTSYLEFIP